MDVRPFFVLPALHHLPGARRGGAAPGAPYARYTAAEMMARRATRIWPRARAGRLMLAAKSIVGGSTARARAPIFSALLPPCASSVGRQDADARKACGTRGTSCARCRCTVGRAAARRDGARATPGWGEQQTARETDARRCAAALMSAIFRAPCSRTAGGLLRCARCACRRFRPTCAPPDSQGTWRARAAARGQQKPGQETLRGRHSGVRGHGHRALTGPSALWRGAARRGDGGGAED